MKRLRRRFPSTWFKFKMWGAPPTSVNIGNDDGTPFGHNLCPTRDRPGQIEQAPILQKGAGIAVQCAAIPTRQIVYHCWIFTPCAGVTNHTMYCLYPRNAQLIPVSEAKRSRSVHPAHASALASCGHQNSERYAITWDNNETGSNTFATSH